jgi:hypothetical protein
MNSSRFPLNLAAVVLAVASGAALAQGAPPTSGSGSNLTTQIEALTARVTALETRMTSTETTNVAQSSQIAAVTGRTSTLEGNLTPGTLAGEYAIVGFRLGTSPLNNPTGFVTHGIAVGAATQSGSASIVTSGGTAYLIINEVCNVGKGAFLWVGNTNLASGVVGKINGAYPATNAPDTTPNPCESYPWGQAGAPIQINGSDIAVTAPDDDGTLQFFTASGGRVWVLDNLDATLVGQNSLPDYAAELVMLVRKAPAAP